MNQILKETKRQKSPKHYCDGVVDFHIIESKNKLGYFFSTMAVFVSEAGYAKAVNCESNFFAPIDLVNAYRKALKFSAILDYPEEDYVNAFKAYLIRTGCKPEELED